MSLTETREQLIRLLTDSDNKVLALSGKWGTGKSHMWDQVVSELGKHAKNNVMEARSQELGKEVSAALYVSLFGLSSIEQVKLKLIQSAAPLLDKHPGVVKTIEQSIKPVLKGLDAMFKGAGVISELGQALAPAVLRKKLIVMDDIERKHEKLSIDEVLGFIDEFTKRHGSRFLLILNSDQLKDNGIWATMREKVIDQELKLTTSSEEAFEIATQIVPSLYADRIKAVIESCGVTNIRIICKVVKAVNLILGGRNDLSESVLARTIPSTILLACIHYKGIENGPDFSAVLTIGSVGGRLFQSYGKKKGEEETDEDKQKAKWRLLLSNLGISSCDDYELFVVEYLESGLFDATKLAEIIQRYMNEGDRTEASAAFHQFFERGRWDYRATVEELLADGKNAAEKAHLVDPYMVTSLHDRLMSIPGGETIAKVAISRWIETFKVRDRDDLSNHDNFFNYKVHPDIEAAFAEAKAAVQSRTTALDACRHVVNKSSWGARQEITIRSMTVQDMDKTIRESSISDMRFFMFTMLGWLKNKSAYEKHFGSAMDNFAEACRTIVNAPDSGRLGALIKNLFEEVNLSHLVEHLQAQNGNQDGEASTSA